MMPGESTKTIRACKQIAIISAYNLLFARCLDRNGKNYMAIREKTIHDGDYELRLENTVYDTIKIRVIANTEPISVVYEGTNKTTTLAIWSFLAKQPGLVWMQLRREHRKH